MVKALIVAVLALAVCAAAPAGSALAGAVQTTMAVLLIVLPMIRALGLREDDEDVDDAEPAR